jgi:translation initiation factor IF-3
MCGLLREKYQLHNEQVQSSGLIKLLDESGRVIGVYTASEARKKTASLNLDMVLVNLKSTPILCKAVGFRQHVIDRFFDQVVAKSQKMCTRYVM